MFKFVDSVIFFGGGIFKLRKILEASSVFLVLINNFCLLNSTSANLKELSAPRISCTDDEYSRLNRTAIIA